MMATLADRERAKLAVRLLEGKPHVTGVVLASVTTEVRDHAFTTHKFPVLGTDVLLVDGNRILIWADLERLDNS